MPCVYKVYYILLLYLTILEYQNLGQIAPVSKIYSLWQVKQNHIFSTLKQIMTAVELSLDHYLTPIYTKKNLVEKYLRIQQAIFRKNPL